MKNGFKSFVIRVIDNIKKPEMKILPAHLAFYFVLTLVPLIGIFGSVLTMFNLSGQYVSSVIMQYLPKAATDLIIGISNGSSIQSHTLFIIIPTFLLASNGMNSMVVTSNSIYKIESKGFIRARVKSIFMLIFLLLLFIFVLLIPVFGNILFNIIADLSDSDMGKVSLIVFKVLKYPLSFFLIYFLVKLLYVMAPDARIKSGSVTYGSLFTTIVWIFVTLIYSFYVENFANYTTFYGSISSIIVLMFWLYLLAYVFVLGMALNASRYDLFKYIVEKERS